MTRRGNWNAPQEVRRSTLSSAPNAHARLLDGRSVFGWRSAQEAFGMKIRTGHYDVWAWVIIRLVAAGVMLAIWTPMLKVMFQA